MVVVDTTGNLFNVYKGTLYPLVCEFLLNDNSKTSHCCGHRIAEMLLKECEWQCPVCHAEYDRDVNPAMNIRPEGHNGWTRQRNGDVCS